MSSHPPGHIPSVPVDQIPPFDRQFFGSDQILSRIGGGAIGGKASGLAFANQIVQKAFQDSAYPDLEISIPRFVVIATDVYDAFIAQNDLPAQIDLDMPDDRIAMLFQRATFPARYAGDLRALISSVTQPLAVRSSSLLEDAMYEPLAGVYGTKMIPNNQGDTETRFRKLVEAVKFVYATAYFRQARGYLSMINRTVADEKMAVIIQEVVGRRHQERFYPTVAGVGRSFNFYPVGNADPEQGVVDLALGLGKTIVDGGRAWTYSPARPKVGPPVTNRELINSTQTEFWAVNMGKPPAFDPVKETEYLVTAGLAEAEYDGVLDGISSTYVAANDRIVPGIGHAGPRILNFAPLLTLKTLPLNEVVTRILQECESTLGAAVEIEFALTDAKTEPRFGLLQVRPMVVSTEKIEIDDAELRGDDVLLASRATLGNGCSTELTDIIYVKPERFAKEHTRAIAIEIDRLNRAAAKENRKYILIGFGRWGSSDPWLGIPVDWGNISGAQVIVEATLPEMNVELSQGAHFFHNMTSLQIPYFCVPFDGAYTIDWNWLKEQSGVAESEFVSYVRAAQPLTVRLDGRSRRGVIRR